MTSRVVVMMSRVVVMTSRVVLTTSRGNCYCNDSLTSVYVS